MIHDKHLNTRYGSIWRRMTKAQCVLLPPCTRMRKWRQQLLITLVVTLANYNGRRAEGDISPPCCSTSQKTALHVAGRQPRPCYFRHALYLTAREIFVGELPVSRLLRRVSRGRFLLPRSPIVIGRVTADRRRKLVRHRRSKIERLVRTMRSERIVISILSW